MKATNVDLHRPEESGGLHSLFERRDPDLGGKQSSLIILSLHQSDMVCSVTVDTNNNMSVTKPRSWCTTQSQRLWV